MLSEMIEKIEGMAVEANGLDLLYETSRKRVYDDHGKILVDEKDIPPRQHKLYSLADLVAALNYGGAQRSIWVSESKIVAILFDDADPASYRDDRLSMDLVQSPFFAVLTKALWLDQRQTIDLLRHDLCGAMIEPDNTLGLLRNLKFVSNSEQTGAVTNASAALGKSAFAEVTGSGALPETVKVEFCPYPALRDLLSADVTIDCTLFLDAQSAKMKLAPRPGELEAAKLTAMQLVQAKLIELAGKDVAVYLGEPGA